MEETSEMELKFLSILVGQANSTKKWITGFYKYNDRSSALNAALSLGKFQALYDANISCFKTISPEIKEMYDGFQKAFTDVQNWNSK